MANTIDGIINLNKPQGKTSFQMVALVRRLTGVRKTGHSGTLDPDATGVLPILIGRATKLASFLTDSTKIYQAEIQFGRSTTTYDASGDTVTEGDASSLTLEIIEKELERFRGDIEQIPPMYSAIKYQGKPLYRLARAGIEIARAPRKVHIFRLEIQDWQSPYLSLEVECSKGTYIRSLAHDLGQSLGCGANMKALIRIKTGPFHIDQSVTADDLETSFTNSSWQDYVHSPDIALSHLSAITVHASEEVNMAHGKPVTRVAGLEVNEEELARAYSEDGRFMALVYFNQETGLWHPKKVFV